MRLECTLGTIFVCLKLQYGVKREGCADLDNQQKLCTLQSRKYSIIENFLQKYNVKFNQNIIAYREKLTLCTTY